MSNTLDILGNYLMEHRDDAEAQQAAQKTLESIVSTRSDVESMYVADDATNVYTHTDKSFVGQIANADKNNKTDHKTHLNVDL